MEEKKINEILKKYPKYSDFIKNYVKIKEEYGLRDKEVYDLMYFGYCDRMTMEEIIEEYMFSRGVIQEALVDTIIDNLHLIDKKLLNKIKKTSKKLYQLVKEEMD